MKLDLLSSNIEKMRNYSKLRLTLLINGDVIKPIFAEKMMKDFFLYTLTHH